MIGQIVRPIAAAAAAAATLAGQARRCCSHVATTAAAAACSANPASASAASALTGALERSTAAGSTVLFSNDNDKWPPQPSSARVTLSLSAAHCFISMTHCRQGLDLTDLPPLVTLMHFRETCGHVPVVVLGDGSAACDTGDRAAAAGSGADYSRASSLVGQLEKVFNIQEELAQRPLPKLRVHRNSEWYRTNIVDFLVQSGRQYRVEDLQLQYQGDAGLPSASLSAFSRIILRAHDWQQVCAMYGPSVQVDGSDLGERMRTQNTRVALDHLRTRWDWNCLGVLLPPLHRTSAKADLVPLVLDDQLACCYDVYQYLQGVPDRVVKSHLLLLTLDSMSDIQEVMSRSEEQPNKRVAQQHLATRIVSLLYGRDAPAQAALATELLFNRSRSLHEATSEELRALRSCLRSHRIKYIEGVSLLDILMHVNCFVQPVDGSTEDPPATERRKQRNMQVIHYEGFSVNAVPVNQNRQITPDDILPSGFTVLGRGRKAYHVIAWE